MNKHYFKRILESIITRKKDALLIFFIVLILSVFIIISTCISSLGETISNVIINDFEVKMYSNSFYQTRTESNYTKLFNNALVGLANDINDIKKEENDEAYITLNAMISSNLANKEYVESFDEYGNSVKEIQYIDAGIYTLIDEDIAKLEGLSIVDGTYLEDDDNYSVLVKNSLYIDGKQVETGDIVTFTINNINYEFNVIGTFNYYNDKEMLGGGFFYSSATDVILTKDVLIEIASENDISLELANLALYFTNGNRYEEMNQIFSAYLFNVINKNNLSNAINDYTINSNIDEYNNMVSPTENMNSLYLIISIVMVLISCLILANVVRYINENRIKEYAILLSLGQNKLLSIMSFCIEVLIITNISITIALPIGISIAKSTSEKLLESNLKRQERLAYITGSEEDLDIFEVQSSIYDTYKVEVNNNDVIKIYLINNGLVVVSCIFVFISIYKSKPRELLLHN